MRMEERRAGRRTLSRLPRSIWALGFAAMFMDISSELVHSLLPVFMSSVLGASMVTIGVIEGIAGATAAMSKVISGALSDYSGKRRSIVMFGYGLSAASKPVFPMACSIGWVAAARFMDRVGKGIRGAPRDALIADVTPPDLRGASYGLRQAMDSVGAFLGPIIAVAFTALLSGDIKAVLWIAVFPAIAAVIMIETGVREPMTAGLSKVKRTSLRLHDVRRLGRDLWLVVALGAIFTLARFSEAFLVLRAHDTGIDVAFVPIVMVVMNGVYAVAAYPAGSASDRLSGRTLLLAGLLVLIFSDLFLATAPSIYMVLAGSALWGLHMALTEGLFARLVADTAPLDLRGTAFGAFNFVTGVSVLLASLIAGALWNSFGPSATFFAGAVFAAVTTLGLFFYPKP